MAAMRSARVTLMMTMTVGIKSMIQIDAALISRFERKAALDEDFGKPGGS